MLEKKYLSEREYIASFTFSDVIAGRSFVTLYLGAATTTTATTYHLMSYVFAGRPTSSTGAEADKDFDVAVNTNLIADGTALLTQAVSANPGNTIQITATLKRIRSGTSTTIGSAIGSLVGATGKICIPITITNFSLANGDTLRLTIASTGGGSDTWYYFDPTSSTQDSKIFIPFKILE